LPVCSGIGLGRGVCARTAVSWVINYDADGKITKTSSLLVLFSHYDDFFVWLHTRDPQI
jgi:hypothetical protein